MTPEIILLRQNELPEAEENTLYLLLSEEEKAALKKIRDHSRQKLKLYAHARLRQEAARRLHTLPEALICVRGEHGKPSFANIDDLHFSLSYTTDAAVVALAPQPVGIDIEKIRPHHMRLGKNLGTTHELSVLQAVPDDLTLFYTFWTRKEAWLKYTGSGLTAPLTSFDVWEDPVFSRLSTFQEDSYCISVCM